MVVFFDGTTYRVADGAHRVLGARKAGVKEIPTVVHDGTAREAFLFAAKCNAHHGRRRTNKDKRYVVSKFLQDVEWGKKSSRWVAEACMVSHTFVQNMKAELATVASPDTVESRDGRLRPATRALSWEKVPQRLAEYGIDKRKLSCALWWDCLARYVVVLDAAGWGPQRIAEFLGVSLEDDVQPILNPRPPVREVADFTAVSAKPELLAKAYREVMGHFIHLWLEESYAMAASTADAEGFPELKAKLAERRLYHGTKAAQLRASVCPRADAEAYRQRSLCVDCCAVEDARLALGIEKDPDRIRRTKQPLNESYQFFVGLTNILKDEGGISF